MINSSSPPPSASASKDEAVDAIVSSGPGGAIAVAGVATAIVIASRLWMTVVEAAPGLILLAVRRPKSSIRNPIAEKHGS